MQPTSLVKIWLDWQSQAFHSLHVQLALPGLAVTSFPLSACSTGPSWTGSHKLSTLHVQLALPGLAVTSFPLSACSTGPSWTGSHKLSTLCMFNWPFLDWQSQAFHSLHVQLALPGLAVTSFPLSACSTGPSWTGSHYLSTLHVQLALPGLGVTNFPHFACSAGPSWTGSCLSTAC